MKILVVRGLNAPLGWKKKTLASSVFAAILFGLGLSQNAPAEQALNLREPSQVIQAYLRAIYARDYLEAYRYISSEDQRVKSSSLYVQQKGAYYGFTLEAAKKLAQFIQINSIQKQVAPDRIEVLARLKVPDLKKLSALLLGWNTYQLNNLQLIDRQKIIDSLEKQNRDGSLAMNDGEEKFDLIKEGNEWRVWLQWAAGIRIPFRILLTNFPELDVSLSKKEVIVQAGDVFEVLLKINHRGSRPIMTRIGHVVEPQAVADYLDFVECGFLLPVTLQPGEQVYSGRYVVRWSIPDGVRRLDLTYDFKPLK